MTRDEWQRRRMNGTRVVVEIPDQRTVTGEVTPQCPKRCDVATPPESLGADIYVCSCCGTQFRWTATTTGTDRGTRRGSG